MSQAMEVFATVRPDLRSFSRDAKSGIVPSLKSIGKAGGMALAAGVATAGVAIAATAVKSIQAFAGFERQMNEVFTLLPGITDDAMGKMSDRVLSFAKDFGTLPEEVVPALYQSLSAGVPEDNVFAFLETAQKAAIGGVTELETAVDGISSVVNAYGSDVLDATEASDIMFTAVRLGKTDFDQLSSSLFNVIPTAASLGVEFGDVAAGLATITAQGTPTSVATTQMRQLFVELSRDGGKVAETFSEISGKSFRDFIASGGNVQDALQLLEQHAADSDVSLSDLFSSVEAGNAALGLTGSGTQAFTDALEAMGTSAGATEQAYARMDEGLSRAMDKIKAGWEVLKISIGEQLAPVVERFADWTIENMPAIEAAVGEAMVGMEDWVVNTGLPAFESMLEWWETNGDTVKGWFAAIAESFGETTSSIDRDAIILQQTYGETAASTKSDTDSIREDLERWDMRFREFMESFGETSLAVNRALTGMVDWFRDGIGDMRDDIVGYGETVSATFDNVVEWFGDLPGRIRGAMGDVKDTLVQKGRDLLSGFTSGLRSAIPGVGDAIDGAWRGAQVGGMMTGPGGGGPALATVQRAMAGLPGLRVTNTYRSPAHNRRVGGAPNSLHMDRANPAVDIAGPAAMLDVLASRLGNTAFRQLIWRAPGHYDHLHYAHAGGRVSANWPTLPGLKNDERPVIAQLGEKITSKGRGGDGGHQPTTIILELNGNEVGRVLVPTMAPGMREEIRRMEVAGS